MQFETMTGLINNTALLLLMGFLYEFLNPGKVKEATLFRTLFVGLAVGSMGIVVMIMPWEFTEGLTFDTRSIVLCLSGVFFGTIPTVLAMFLTITMRIAQGGVGTFVGCSVITASGVIGLLWRKVAVKRPSLYSLPWLYVLGLLVHVVMLLIMLMLPKDLAASLLKTITLPVMLIYPVGTALLGKLLAGRMQKNLLIEKFQQNREQLQVTLQSIADGVISTDIEGKIVLMNSVAESLTGWSREEAEGKFLVEIYTPGKKDDVKNPEGILPQLLQQNISLPFPGLKFLINAETGKKILVEDSLAAIHDSAGKKIGMVLVFRDITERTRMLETIQRSEKLESLGLLAGGIAHDFNNLLGGIFGYTELANLLLEGKDPDGADSILTTAKNYLHEAAGAYERARDLTQQLLTFSKGGEPKLERQQLETVVQKSAAFALSGSDIRLNFELRDHLPPCCFDENQVGQVIDNIIINAKQAMSNGGTITITMNEEFILEQTHTELVEGQYICTRITDTGTGMDQNTLKHIFDPFFTTKPTGQGLGLAVSHSIMQRHRGTLEASSQLGEGSCFTIYLPVAGRDEGANPLQEAESTAEPGNSSTDTGSETPMEKQTIVIMDDEEMICDILKTMLESLNFSVLVCHDGGEAVALIQQYHTNNQPLYAAIFDLTVPGGLGGREAAARVREELGIQDLPIFASSGYSVDPVIAKPEDYGFSGSIQKPFSLRDISQLLCYS